MSKNNVKSLLPVVFKGFAMGACDVVPGVSGGTVALIVGIYELLVGEISTGTDALVLVVRGKFREGMSRLRDVGWLFLASLLAGILLAVVLASHLIPQLLDEYPMVMSAIFFGLVATSLRAPYMELDHPLRNQDWLAIALAAVGGFLLVGLRGGAQLEDPSLVIVFFSAALAICAMILPGISGSYILLILGMYTATFSAIKGLNILFLIVFGLGAVIGLGSFSKLLHYLLNNHKQTTMSVLLGLMLGSLRTLFPYGLAETPLDFAVATLAILLGVMAVNMLISISLR